MRGFSVSGCLGGESSRLFRSAACGRNPNFNFGSSAESVGALWFRERAQVVIERDFGSVEGPKSLCLSQS